MILGTGRELQQDFLILVDDGKSGAGGIGLRRGGLHRRSLARREEPDQGRLEGDRTVI